MLVQKIAWYDVAYDVVVIFVTAIVIWLLSISVASLITLGVLGLVIIVPTIGCFHNGLIPAHNYRVLIGLFISGFVIVVLSLRIEPVWWNFIYSYLNSSPHKAIKQLQSQPHANMLLVLGLFGIYVSIFGLIRIPFIYVLRRVVEK